MHFSSCHRYSRLTVIIFLGVEFIEQHIHHGLCLRFRQRFLRIKEARINRFDGMFAWLKIICSKQIPLICCEAKQKVVGDGIWPTAIKCLIIGKIALHEEVNHRVPLAVKWCQGFEKNLAFRRTELSSSNKAVWFDAVCSSVNFWVMSELENIEKAAWLLRMSIVESPSLAASAHALSKICW